MQDKISAEILELKSSSGLGGGDIIKVVNNVVNNFLNTLTSGREKQQFLKL
jgi:hypothetical protein